MAIRIAYIRPRRVPAAATHYFGAAPSSSSTTLPSCRRPFFSLPGSSSGDNPSAQHLSARRVLPYHVGPLYSLIADVDSYSSFVPYCSHSRVTQWSSPDPKTGRRLPTQADLHVGWGGLNESFTSRLICVPDVSVEAVSGADEGGGISSSVFNKLVTRWSVRALSPPSSSQTSGEGQDHPPRTEVNLVIQYEFANPLYAAFSSAVSDKVAGMMIEAFEKRARERLGGSRTAA